MFEISYLSLLPVYILNFFNTQIAFNLVARDVSSVWGFHLNSSYVSISQEITFCSFFFRTPSAQHAHPSSHVKGKFIVFSSSPLVGSFPEMCKAVCAVPQFSDSVQRSHLAPNHGVRSWFTSPYSWFSVTFVLSSSDFLLISRVYSAEWIIWPLYNCQECTQ